MEKPKKPKFYGKTEETEVLRKNRRNRSFRMKTNKQETKKPAFAGFSLSVLFLAFGLQAFQQLNEIP